MSGNRLLIAVVVIAIIIISAILLYKPEPDVTLPSIPRAPMVMAMAQQGEDGVTLHIGWNMVSMPEYTNKTEVYFTYENETYNWTEATQMPIIADDLRTYDGNDYIEVSAFLKTKGYWLYSFREPVYISSQPLVLYCGKIFFDGNGTLNCTRLVISPDLYDNEIHCESITVQEVCFYYYNVGQMP